MLGGHLTPANRSDTEEFVTVLDEVGARAWDRKTVVFVDEAAMLDNRTMRRLLEQADMSGAKVVMIGDDAQLASIQRGGMYTEIQVENG